MCTFEEIMQKVFSDSDVSPEQIPSLDLYMDQVLTLFNEGFRDDKRHPEDKLLTKTMINNYTREKLLSPIQGKKYSHRHMMQMLCVYQLKQALALSDIKRLTGREDVDFEACWRQFLARKKELREEIPAQLSEKFSVNLDDPDERLTLCLTLSAAAFYLRRLCESVIDASEE